MLIQRNWQKYNTGAKDNNPLWFFTKFFSCKDCCLHFNSIVWIQTENDAVVDILFLTDDAGNTTKGSARTKKKLFNYQSLLRSLSTGVGYHTLPLPSIPYPSQEACLWAFQLPGCQTIKHFLTLSTSGLLMICSWEPWWRFPTVYPRFVSDLDY